MNRWLKGDSTIALADTLSDGHIPLKETYVTGTGQVMSYFKGEKSILDYAVEMLEKSKPGKIKFLTENSYPVIAGKAAELIGFQKPDNIKGGGLKGTFEWEGFTVEKHLINRDRNLSLPALIIKPKKIAGSGVPAIVFSGCFGKMNEITKNKQLVIQKLKEGYVVMVVDVSNTGELRTQENSRQVNYEFFVGKMPIYAGRTLLGYRTEDLVIARDYLQTVVNINNKKVEILASEQVGPSAIHAAFIDGGFSKLYLMNTIDSWESIVKTHFTPDNIGIIVPNVLKYYDLPDLELLLKNKKIPVIRLNVN